MDARCEVCGVAFEISDQPADGSDGGKRRAVREFECRACGTPHFVARSRAHRLPRSAIARNARKKIGASIPPSAEPPLQGERISDLQTLAERSSTTVERVRISRLDLEQVLAPPDVIESIRASLPPVSSPERDGNNPSTRSSVPPQLLDLHTAVSPRRRSRFTTVAALSALGLLVAAGGSALARKDAAAPAAFAASAEVADSARAAGRRAELAVQESLLAQRQAEALRKAGADAPPPKVHRPKQVAPAGASPSAAPQPAQARAAAPTMTLADAIAAAAGKPAKR